MMPVDLDSWIDRVAGAGGAPSSGSGDGERAVYLGGRELTPNVSVSTPNRTVPKLRSRGKGLTPDVVHVSEPSGPPQHNLSWTADVDSLENQRRKMFEWWGTAKFDAWGDWLVRYGLIDEGESRDFEVLNDWWQDALELSASFFEAGRHVSPEQALRVFSERGGGPGRGGRGGGGFTGRRSQTHRDFDLTNPTDAKRIVNDVLANALGRAATDEELDTFRAALNAQERANPVVTTQTADLEDGVTVSSSSTRTGGVDQNQVVLDEAMELPEYGAYQAASTYLNALFGAIQSPV